MLKSKKTESQPVLGKTAPTSQDQSGSIDFRAVLKSKSQSPPNSSPPSSQSTSKLVIPQLRSVGAPGAPLDPENGGAKEHTFNWRSVLKKKESSAAVKTPTGSTNSPPSPEREQKVEPAKEPEKPTPEKVKEPEKATAEPVKQKEKKAEKVKEPQQQPSSNISETTSTKSPSVPVDKNIDSFQDSLTVRELHNMKQKCQELEEQKMKLEEEVKKLQTALEDEKKNRADEVRYLRTEINHWKQQHEEEIKKNNEKSSTDSSQIEPSQDKEQKETIEEEAVKQEEQSVGKVEEGQVTKNVPTRNPIVDLLLLQVVSDINKLVEERKKEIA